MPITKTCAVSGKEFVITDSDLLFYEKLGVPSPTLCPEERARRRYAWRNERKLYWRECAGTGKRVLSVFSENKPFTVYSKEYWYSDHWEPLDYGRDFDFQRGFFEQFRELMEAVPQVAASNLGHSENSDYCNQCDALKDCYLVFEANDNESCYYCGQISHSKNCIDCFSIQRSEKLYKSVDCETCFDSKFLQNAKNCRKSWFLKNCMNCDHCFGSMNLQGKKYYFFNKAYSKEEYFQKVEELSLDNYTNLEEVKQRVEKFFLQFPEPYMNGYNNENSNGDYLNNTQNCENCYDVQDAQNCKNVFYGYGLNNVHDMTVYGDGGVEYCYENHCIGQNIRNICFCDQVWESCHDIFYSQFCMDQSHNLFGCVGLRNSKYCILNKQYSKKEYFELREKIVAHMKKSGEWGEFLPMSISPFGYNETVAQQFYPLVAPDSDINKSSPNLSGRREIASFKYNWYHQEEKQLDVEKSIPAERLPNCISDIPDDILNWAIICEKTGKPFRIIAQELDFYRKQNLPIPHVHSDQRYLDMFHLRNPRKLFERTCDHCKKSLQSSYSLEREEVVYCKECWEREVV